MIRQAPEPSFSRLATFAALRASALEAARGHRRSAEVAEFFLDLEPRILALERELVAGTFRPAPYRTFFIREPKPRTISAARFGDRVVHHAVCREIEPVLEAVAIPWSFACRRGKGVLAALRHVRRLCRRFPYVLKTDVLHFFESADHGVLKRLLARRVRDPDLRRLIFSFIDAGAPGSAPGKGLPIGNLTSQHFANFYLGPLDRHLVRGAGAGGYCRYMDDILVFAHGKARLWEALAGAERFAADRLKVALKPSATRVLRVDAGVPFLGFIVFPGLIRLDGARVRRLRRRFASLGRAIDAGLATEDHVQRSADSLVGWARHADTAALLRSWVRRRTP
ncbi:MAG: RNA-dependent DNA polymerase [Candidatus Sericytochromatia bacterium]|nr:RNA-dependent DNA polymerase [Candidatus Tanganyikabacteria bacterium]